MKFFLAVLLACSVGMPKANAQHEAKIGGSSVTAVHAIDGTHEAVAEANIEGTYEHVINEHTSVLISGTYIQSYHLNFDYSGFRMTPQFRYYFRPGDDNAKGFFASAFLSYRYTKGVINFSIPTFSFPFFLEEETFEYEQTTNSTGIGIGTGYKFAFDSGFVFEVLAGYGCYFMHSLSTLTYASIDDIGDIGDRSFVTLTLNNFRFAFNIGWRFGGAFRNKKNENR